MDKEVTKIEAEVKLMPEKQKKEDLKKKTRN